MFRLSAGTVSGCAPNGGLDFRGCCGADLLLASTLDEFSQGAFPTRTFELGDLAMNVVGIVALGSFAARVPARRGRTDGRQP